MKITVKHLKPVSKAITLQEFVRKYNLEVCVTQRQDANPNAKSKTYYLAEFANDLVINLDLDCNPAHGSGLTVEIAIRSLGKWISKRNLRIAGIQDIVNMEISPYKPSNEDTTENI